MRIDEDDVRNCELDVVTLVLLVSDGELVPFGIEDVEDVGNCELGVITLVLLVSDGEPVPFEIEDVEDVEGKDEVVSDEVVRGGLVLLVVKEVEVGVSSGELVPLDRSEIDDTGDVSGLEV